MQTTLGITGFGGYVPRLRMQRAAIAEVHKWMAPSLRSLAKGERAFCSWDEDSVTMAVEAARDAIGARRTSDFVSIALASTTLPFADFQSGALVAGALGLPRGVRTIDFGNSQRAGTAGLISALQQAQGPSLYVASDRPRARPASTQEMVYGAGAAAFTLGSEGVLVELLGAVSLNEMFVDHFRPAGGRYDYVWEERWIRDEGYGKLVPEAIAEALSRTGLAPADVNHFILAAPLKGVAAMVARKAGLSANAEAEGLDGQCGFAGTAHGLMMLARVLEGARPRETILVAGFGQGVDVLVLRTTEQIGSFSPRRGLGGALVDAQTHDAYLRMLSFEGSIDLDWGMRAERQLKTALTEQYRSQSQLAHFNAGRCARCMTIQFPQLAYCVNPGCAAPRSQFEPVSLIDEKCRVLTYTADWLSYHPAPPLYVGFTQFDNGARLLTETVDVGPAGLEEGMPLRVVFRVKDIDRDRGYPRYFWKTTPLRA